MNTPRYHLPARSLITLVVFAASAPALCAQTTPPLAAVGAVAPATITGRVQYSASGQYLNNAHVTVKGTDLVTFTDDSGTYRLDRVPGPTALLEVFYTGLQPQQIPVTLSGGGLVEQDVNLTVATAQSARANDVVKLGSFVVSDTRETNGSAIAINEQRFAANMVNVVTADEFGLVPDGNIGEFLKLLPSITMSYRGGDPREISMDGVSSANVPVTVGGFSLATPEVSGTGRNVELNSISINSMARVAASFSPTPESPGSALASSVNLLPRSAFKRSRPMFSSSVYVIMRDNARDFNKTPGPRAERTRKVQPGFEFSWIVPENKKSASRFPAAPPPYTPPSPPCKTRGAGAAPPPTVRRSPTPSRTGLTCPTIWCATARPAATVRRSVPRLTTA